MFFGKNKLQIILTFQLPLKQPTTIQIKNFIQIQFIKTVITSYLLYLPKNVDFCLLLLQWWQNLLKERNNCYSFPQHNLNVGIHFLKNNLGVPNIANT